MNSLVRTLVGVVIAKAAVVAGWYLYQKSTEWENDWMAEEDSLSKEAELTEEESSEVSKPVVESPVKEEKNIVSGVETDKLVRALEQVVLKSKSKLDLKSTTVVPPKVKKVAKKNVKKSVEENLTNMTNGLDDVPTEVKVKKVRKTVTKKAVPVVDNKVKAPAKTKTRAKKAE